MAGVRPFTDQEVVLLLDNCSSLRDRLMLVLMLKTGLRIQEMLSLTWKDVWDSHRQEPLGSLHVQRKFIKNKQAGRVIPLQDIVKDAIRAYRASITVFEGQVLFLSEKGYNRSIGRVQAYRIVSALAKSLRLMGRIGCHSTRKTFGDKLYKASGRDIAVTSKGLGHKNLSSTISYLSVLEEDVNELILAI